MLKESNDNLRHQTEQAHKRASDFEVKPFTSCGYLGAVSYERYPCMETSLEAGGRTIFGACFFSRISLSGGGREGRDLTL